MQAEHMQEKIMKYIRERSGYETRRTYVGMSHLGDCPADIYVDFRDGLETSDRNHRMAYLGYALERVIKDILIDAGRQPACDCRKAAANE